MAGFVPGDEYREWKADFRGFGGRRFVGTEKDPATGRDVRVFEVAGDAEWGTRTRLEFETPLEPIRTQVPELGVAFTPPDQIGLHRHLTYHRHVYDPNCKYCER